MHGNRSREISLSSKLHFVNRKEELRLLGNVLNLQSAGANARVALVYGTSGVGKTELVAHAIALHAEAHLVVRVACSPAESSMPFRTLLAVAEEISRRSAEGGQESLQQFLLRGGSPFLRRNHGKEVLDKLALILPRLGALAQVYAQPLLGVGKFDEGHYLINDPIQAVLADYLQSAFEAQALVLFIDDVQFIDSNSLVALSSLAGSVTGRLSLVLTYRMDDPAALHRREHIADKFYQQTDFVPIPAQPLSRWDFGLLVKDLVRSSEAEAERLVDRLYGLTKGDLRGFIDRAHAANLGTGHMLLPDFVTIDDESEVLGARLSRLPPGLRQTLAVVCAYGASFPLGTLKKALSISPVAGLDVLDAHLDDLVGQDLLRTTEDRPGERRVEVAHPRVREMVMKERDSFVLFANAAWATYFGGIYASRRFVEHSERDVLYRLILHKALVEPDSVVPLLKDALAVALQFDDIQSAAVFARDCAEALSASGEPPLALKAESARLFYGIGQYQDALDILGTPFDPEPVTPEAASAQVLRLMARERLDAPGVESECARLRAHLESRFRQEPRMREYALASALVEMTCHTSARDYKTARRLFKDALQTFADLPGSRLYPALLRNSEQVMDPDESLPFIRRSIEAFQSAGDPRGAATARTSLGMQLIRLGFLVEARQALEEAERNLRALGSYDLGTVWNDLAVIHLLEGRAQEAVPLLRKALLLSDYPFSNIVVKVNLATALRQTGDEAGASALCEDVAVRLVDFPDPELVVEAGYQATRNLFLMERKEQAADLFAQTCDGAKTWWDWDYWLDSLAHALDPANKPQPKCPRRLSYLFQDRFDAYPLLSFWHFDPPA